MALTQKTLAFNSGGVFGPPNREGSVKVKAKFKFTGEEAPARGAAVSATPDLSFECRSVRGKKKEKKRAGKLGSSGYKIKSGKAKTVKIKLNRKGRKALRRSKPAKLVLAPSGVKKVNRVRPRTQEPAHRGQSEQGQAQRQAEEVGRSGSGS